MRTKPIFTLPPLRMVVRGSFGDDVAELVADKLAHLTRHAHAPILDVHVRLIRHQNAAVALPVEAEVSLDISGRHLRAEARATTLRDALDQVADRLARQMDRRPGWFRARMRTRYRRSTNGSRS
jgi:ribosomal subunit interface protein